MLTPNVFVLTVIDVLLRFRHIFYTQTEGRPTTLCHTVRSRPSPASVLFDEGKENKDGSLPQAPCQEVFKKHGGHAPRT